MVNAEEADRTLFIRNLDSKVTEELLFELFVQAGPLIKTKIPKDKTFGFAVYKHEESVHYAIELLNGTSLYGRSIQVQFRSGSSHGTSPGGISKNSSPANTPNLHGQRMQNQDGSSYSQMQRSFSSPENLQKQVVMNNVWQLQLMQLQQLHRVKAGYAPDLLGQVITPQMDVDLLQASLSPQKQQQQQQQQQYRGGSRDGGGSWPQESSSQRGYRQHPYQDDRGNSSGYTHHGRSQRYGDDSSSGRHQRGQGNQGNHYNHHDDRTGSRGWDSRDNRRRY